MKLTTIARLIRAAFSPAVVAAFPPDLQADNEALYGLIGFWRNANAASDGRVAITTAGTDSTLTAAQVALGAIILAAGASGGFTITLPTTAAILSALGPTIPTDGSFSKVIRIKNDGVGQTGTLTAGDASTTINGTATIATNTTRTFLLTVASASTITIDNMGSMAL